MLRIEERPVRKRVLVISRTIASKRCASTGEQGRVDEAVLLHALGLRGFRSWVIRAPICSCRLGHVSRPARVDHDGRLRLDHDRRPLGDGARAPCAAPRWIGTSTSPRSGMKARPGAVAPRPSRRRERRSLPTAGFLVATTTRPFHWLSSIFCPGSRTAKIRSWASWKLSIRASSEASSGTPSPASGIGDVPDLVGVARLDVVAAAGLAVEAGRQLLLELRHPPAQVGDRRRHTLEVEVLRVRRMRSGDLADDVAVLAAEGREDARGLRDQHLAAAELAGDREDGQPGGSAPGDQAAVARIDPLVHRQFLDRRDHPLVGDREDRMGGLFGADRERLGEPLRSPLRPRARSSFIAPPRKRSGSR